VYVTELTTKVTRRLTPHEIADFSPAISPSGVYTVVASYRERGRSGEVEELSTNIYLFLTLDETN
jgi:Tol biopolymer transport system component